jgi:hypothetical protein
MNAIASVLKILKENSNVLITEFQKEVTFDSYLTKILYIQSTLNQSGKLNILRTDSNQQPTNPRETSIRKHARRLLHEMDPESEDDDDKPSKKSKLLKRDMPWFSESDDSSIFYSDPSCKQPVGYSEPTTKTYLKPNFLSKSLQTPPPA